MNAGIFFAERLGKMRALTNEETDMLENLMKRARLTPSRFWTAREDRMLLRAMRASPRNYAAEIAAETGRTAWSVRSRARKVRAR